MPCTREDNPSLSQVEPSEAEIQSLFSDLAEAGKPAILFLVPGFSHNYVPLCARNMLPRPLTDLFKEESGQEESGEMIACDTNDCPIIWFYTSCLKIQHIPKGKWYCPQYRESK